MLHRCEGESKQKTVCRACTDGIRVIKAGLLEWLLQCACSRGRVEVRSWSLKLRGLTLASCSIFTRPVLVRAHHSGNNERSRPKTHAVEAQWQRVCWPLQAACQRAESQHMCSLLFHRYVANVEHTHKHTGRGIQNMEAFLGVLEGSSLGPRKGSKWNHYQQFILSERFTRIQLGSPWGETIQEHCCIWEIGLNFTEESLNAPQLQKVPTMEHTHTHTHTCTHPPTPTTDSLTQTITTKWLTLT